MALQNLTVVEIVSGSSQTLPAADAIALVLSDTDTYRLEPPFGGAAHMASGLLDAYRSASGNAGATYADMLDALTGPAGASGTGTYGLGTSAETSGAVYTDMNSVPGDTAQFFKANTPWTNTPNFGYGAGFQSTRSAGAARAQFFLNTTTANPRAWIRNYFGGNWSTWAELAKLDSPAFTGTPTAPTPADADNSTKLATTAFVNTRMASVQVENVVRTAAATEPVNTQKVWISETGWNPEERPIYGRSTPKTARLAIGEHLDKWGAPSRHYDWGISTWFTNPNTAPLTNIDAVAQGFRVRAMGANARQCGNGGDGHALEILSGQFAAQCQGTLTAGTPNITVTGINMAGSRFCIGDTIEGNGIPVGATIISLTKNGKVYTDRHAQSADTAVAGSGYVKGDILTVASGGAYTVPAQIEVLSVNGSGGVTTAGIVEPGNYTTLPTGPVPVTGGTGTGATFDMTFLVAGFGFPDIITMSANATETGSRQIEANGPDNMNIGILITGSGSGGTDKKGNANGRAIQFQSYGDAKYKYGLIWGGGGVRSDGTAIHVGFEDVWKVFDITNVTGLHGIHIRAANTFTGAALQLDSQKIGTDTAGGLTIATAATQKLGFYGKAPVARPSGVAVSAAGIHAALVSLGLIT